MLRHFEAFFLSNYYAIERLIFFYYTALFLIFGVLLFFNRKEISKQFEHLNKRYVLILAVILLIYALFLTALGLPYVENIAGWEINLVAKEYSEGNFIFFEHETITVYVLALMFSLIGPSIYYIKIFYLLLHVLGIMLLFFTTYLLFKSNKVALLSALIYTLNPLSISYSVITNGRASSAMVACTFLILIAILSFRIKNSSGFLLGLVSLLLAGNSQLDFMIFLIPYLLMYFYINRESVKTNTAGILLSLVFFGIFSVYYASHAFAMEGINKNIALGDVRNIYSSLIETLNPTLKNLAGTSWENLPSASVNTGSFSPAYFAINSLIFLNNWLFKDLFMAALFLLFLFGWYTNRKNLKVTFILSLFFIYAFVHLLYYYPYDERFMVVMMPIVAMFGGSAIVKILDFSPFRKNRVLPFLFILALAFVLLFSIFNFINTISNAKESPFPSWQDNTYLAESVIDLTGKNTTILSEGPRFSIILKFIGAYDETMSFHNVGGWIDLDNYQLSLFYSGKVNLTYFQESGEFSEQREFLQRLVGKKTKIYVFLEGDCKHTWMSTDYKLEPGYCICEYVLQNYNFKKVSSNFTQFSKYGNFTLYEKA